MNAVTVTSKTTTTRRKRMPRAQREHQMLEVAVAVFSEHGYVAASMDDIAERVGVSKPMLYEYFTSKEGLLLAAIRRARAELRTATQEAVMGAHDGQEALRLGLRAFFTFVEERRQAWSLLRQESSLLGTTAAEEVEAIRMQQTEFQIQLLKLYMPEAPEIFIEAASEFLVGACERMALWCQRTGKVTPDQAADYTFAIFWAGLSGQLGAELGGANKH